MLKDFLILFISVAISVYSYSIFEKKRPEYNRDNKPFLGVLSVGLVTASINSFLSVFF